MFNISIPKLSDEELLKRYEQIKPLVRIDGKLRFLKKYTDVKELREYSFFFNKDGDSRKLVRKKDFQAWKDIVCIHTFGFPGCFCPTVAEILSQITEHDAKYVKAFEIIDSPKVAADFHKDRMANVAFEQCYHVSVVRLYTASPINRK